MKTYAGRKSTGEASEGVKAASLAIAPDDEDLDDGFFSKPSAKHDTKGADSMSDEEGGSEADEAGLEGAEELATSTKRLSLNQDSDVMSDAAEEEEEVQDDEELDVLETKEGATSPPPRAGAKAPRVDDEEEDSMMLQSPVAVHKDATVEEDKQAVASPLASPLPAPVAPAVAARRDSPAGDKTTSQPPAEAPAGKTRSKEQEEREALLSRIYAGEESASEDDDERPAPKAPAKPSPVAPSPTAEQEVEDEEEADLMDVVGTAATEGEEGVARELFQGAATEAAGKGNEGKEKDGKAKRAAFLAKYANPDDEEPAKRKKKKKDKKDKKGGTEKEGKKGKGSSKGKERPREEEREEEGLPSGSQVRMSRRQAERRAEYEKLAPLLSSSDSDLEDLLRPRKASQPSAGKAKPKKSTGLTPPAGTQRKTAGLSLMRLSDSEDSLALSPSVTAAKALAAAQARRTSSSSGSSGSEAERTSAKKTKTASKHDKKASKKASTDSDSDGAGPSRRQAATASPSSTPSSPPSPSRARVRPSLSPGVAAALASPMDEEKGDKAARQRLKKNDAPSSDEERRKGLDLSELELSEGEDAIMSGDEEVIKRGGGSVHTETKAERKARRKMEAELLRLQAQKEVDEKVKEAVKKEELEDLRAAEKKREATEKVRELLVKRQAELSEKAQQRQTEVLGRLHARHRPLADELAAVATEELRALVQEKKAEREKAKKAKGGKVDEAEEEAEEGFVDPAAAAAPMQEAEPTKPQEEEEEEEEEESGSEEESGDEDDDDMELEVVSSTPAPTQAAAAPVPPIRRILGLGRSTAPASSSSSLFAVANVVRSNPTSHRAQLRRQLQEQARHQGATWLARELGYKDFREHQRDLKIMELKRKAMSSRLKAREEEEQRQRIASRPHLQEGEEEDEDGDEEYKGEEEGSGSSSGSEGSEGDVEDNNNDSEDDTPRGEEDEEEAAARAALRRKDKEEQADEEEDEGEGEEGDKQAEGEGEAVEMATADETPVFAGVEGVSVAEAEDGGAMVVVEGEGMLMEEGVERQRSVSSISMDTTATLVDSDGSQGTEPSPTPDSTEEPGEAATPPAAASATPSATATVEALGETQVQTQVQQVEEEAPAKLVLQADGSLKPAAKQMGISRFFSTAASSGSAGVSMAPPPPPVPKKGSLLAAFQKRAAAQAANATAEGESAAKEGEAAAAAGAAASEAGETQEDGEEATQLVEEEEELEEEEEEEGPKEPVDRAAAYKAMIEAEKRQYKRQKKAGKSSLLDVEAEEEEEEDMLKGLEDYGFGAVNKEAQKAQALGEENEDVELRDDDFENIVDTLSDGEGDEDAGRDFAVQKELEQDKEALEEVIRRVKEGHDGRRGGLTRGKLRLDQLVGGDKKSRREAKRLGLLNSDEELSSEDEDGDGNDPDKVPSDEEDVEEALIKAQRDRVMGFRNQMSMYHSSDDEEEEDTTQVDGTQEADVESQEQEREERLRMKAWSRRAKMRRLLEMEREQQAADAGTAGKVRRLLDHDTESQHILGLLQRTNTVNGQNRKRKEKEFNADILSLHDPDLAHSNMAFPPPLVKRRITSTESRMGGNSNTGHSNSNSSRPPTNANSNGAAPSGIFTRIREIQAADGRSLARKGSFLSMGNNGFKRQGSFTAGMGGVSSTAPSTGGLRGLSVAPQHKFVFTSTSTATLTAAATHSHSHGAGGDIMLEGGGSSSFSRTGFSDSQSGGGRSLSRSASVTHEGSSMSGGLEKRSTGAKALWKGVSQKRCVK